MLKVASRCDLACKYCYVYESPDHSWMRRPLFIAEDTVKLAAARIAEHADAHGLAQVRVILHGGEPLLAGQKRLEAIIQALRSALGGRAELSLQSNGVLLDEELCKLFAAHRVRLSVSLDGDAAANDRYRLYANGRSSHAAVRDALTLLRRPEFKEIYTGLLCTVDLANDPVAVFDALARERPPRIDFLLPHANWDRPPQRPAGVPAPYADWLLAVHRHRLRTGSPVRVRLLDAAQATTAGGASDTEALGLSPAALVVIEADGSYEQVDALKSAYDGAPQTGLDIVTNTVDDVAAHPMIALRQAGVAGLSATCQACEVVQACGGGHFAHRYRAGSGFDNPSVYCADLKALVTDLRPRPPGLPATVLDDLATGYGTAATAARLAGANLSIVRARLTLLAPHAAAHPVAGPAWDLLLRLDLDHRTAVRTVLDHPFLREWMASLPDEPRPAPIRGAGLGQLAGIAAAAAVRAGVTADLVVPVHDGRAHLPGLGAFAAADGTDRLPVSIVDGRLGRPPGDPAWRASRRVAAGGLDLLLEDGDPHRDCFGGVNAPAPPLDDDQAEQWVARLDGALRWLQDEAPEYLPGIRGTLRAVVPLPAEPGAGLRSAAARRAFGAVALSPADDPATLAELLVHEVQHLKLYIALDICSLIDRDDRRLVPVPWLRDPRPVEAALQGAYAFAAVGDLRRRRAEPGAAHQARQYQANAAGVLDLLLDGPGLTADGARFTRRLRASLDGW
ncbi:FxsB family cyclophane-forming radical SAM/SPASM peptide maturase [Dactylosporangium sp. NPDC051541]|uniref:FxsB family cyclophane-forming radical SAM/SPASM peptide maturase n=1 Tax=Dactylosporangium sp. NPDC051541 TaxID=3363977 RepID=UPI00378C51CE